MKYLRFSVVFIIAILVLSNICFATGDNCIAEQNNEVNIEDNSSISSESLILGMDFSDIIPIIISVIALILSIYQYFGEYKRAKKKDTLEEIYQLQNDVFDNLNVLRSKYSDLRVCYPEKNIEPKIDSSDRNKITNYLAKLERFCAGIDERVYSKSIVKKIGGEFLIRQYLYLRPVIVNKRIRRFDSNKKRQEVRYHKFEKIARKLNKIYNYDLNDKELVNRLKDNGFEKNIIDYVIGH